MYLSGRLGLRLNLGFKIGVKVRLTEEMHWLPHRQIQHRLAEKLTATPTELTSPAGARSRKDDSMA